MTTSTQTQLRRGTASQVAGMTPAAGEVVVNTTDNRLHCGDGLTAGGIPHANSPDVQNQTFTYSSVGGTANAITLTNAPPITAYGAGQKFTFKAASSNSAAVQVNVDTLGLKDVKKMNNGALAALVANDIISGGVYDILYDGTQFQIKGLAEGPFSSGALKFLGKVTASSSSTVDLTSLLSSTYDDYLIVLDNVLPSNNGVSLQMRFSTDNSTFDSGSNYRWAINRSGSGGTGSIAGGSSQTSVTVADTCANTQGLNGDIRLYGVNTTTVNRMITADLVWEDNNILGISRGACGGEWVNTSNAIEAVRFFFSGGNIASGSFKVFGIAKS